MFYFGKAELGRDELEYLAGDIPKVLKVLLDFSLLLIVKCKRKEIN